MKIAIVLNKNRVSDELQTLLKNQDLKESYQIDYDLFLVEPAELEATLSQLNHQSYNAFLIGGGDGTVRTAVQALSEYDIPIAILPLGTFNFLATTLNHPNDIKESFAMIKNNKTKQVDIAEVNGQTIINHAWIGFYYYIIRMREKHKDILGKNKLLKILFNTFNLFRSLPIYHLTIHTDQETIQHDTCLVYVSNNESSLKLMDFGERKSLSSGLLSVTILKCTSRLELFLCMIDLALNRIKTSKYIEQYTVDSFTITAKNNMINLVIDGELFKLETPLHFTNHQKKLTVLIP